MNLVYTSREQSFHNWLPWIVWMIAQSSAGVEVEGFDIEKQSIRFEAFEKGSLRERSFLNS